jgi:hypothetical protein
MDSKAYSLLCITIFQRRVVISLPWKEAPNSNSTGQVEKALLGLLGQEE